MKISKEEKEAVAKKIVAAGAKLIGEQGFETTSMRQIAKAAGVGEATIYRYYPSKYALIYGFYDDLHERMVERLRKIEQFESYSFTEQVQILIYTQLDLIKTDRDFVKESYQTIIKGGFMQATSEAFALREKGKQVVAELLEAAIEAGEFAEPPLKGAITSSILDLMIGIVYYWQTDDSPQHQNTLQLVDKLLAITDSLLKSNILGNIVDMFQFLFREHIVSQLSRPSQRNIDFDEIKRQFTGATDE